MKWFGMVAVLLLGCTVDTEETGEEDTTPQEDTDVPKGCEEVSLDIRGPDEPIVGDEWTILMRCDDAVLTGPMVIRFTPPDFANLDANTVLFTTAGSASMRVQLGAYRVDREITVSAE